MEVGTPRHDNSMHIIANTRGGEVVVWGSKLVEGDDRHLTEIKKAIHRETRESKRRRLTSKKLPKNLEGKLDNRERK